MDNSTSTPHVTRFGHFTLATNNAEASRRFFADTFGWETLPRPENVEINGAWMELSEGQQLHLVEVPGFEVSQFEGEFGRHLAVEYPKEGFCALKERLVACGAELLEPERETPFERFFFIDPAGYVFEVVDSGRVPEA